MIRICFAALLALAVALPLGVAAADFAPPPTPNHYVTDGSGALSSAARTSLENELRAYETATGHQVIVWIGKTTGDVPLETWTTQTADRWKIGRRGHDDGAILFLFMDDHKVRIEVGYGLEGALTDAQAHGIIDNDIVPRMRSGNTDDAVSSGVAAMLTTISPSYKNVTPPPAAPAEHGTTIGGPAAVVLMVVFGLFFAFVLFMIVMQIVGMFRYGYLVMREGSKRASADMRRWWFWGGAGFLGGSSSSFGGGGGGFSGGFSAGGGGFGGGGASGGW